MRVFNGYPVSIIVSVLFHGLVLLALFYFQQANTEVIDIVRPPSVKALLVAENPQEKNADIQQQRQAQRVQEQRREEQRRQAQAEAQRVQEQQQAAEREASQERAALQQRQDQERRQAEQKRLADEQQQRDEQQRRENEQRRQQEVAAQQEAARQEQIRQEQALQAQRDAEATEVARTESERVMSYSAVIHDLVQQNWSRPPSARNGMVVVLRIRMVPTGDVIEVEIVQSSGDFAFDRAAESAVLKVRRFTELQGMDTRMFDRNFRTFLLTFRPQDLLN
ncbi:MAG: TonB family protein [Gammaproteobacteria bacterium]